MPKNKTFDENYPDPVITGESNTFGLIEIGKKTSNKLFYAALKKYSTFISDKDKLLSVLNSEATGCFSSTIFRRIFSLEDLRKNHHRSNESGDGDEEISLNLIKEEIEGIIEKLYLLIEEN